MYILTAFRYFPESLFMLSQHSLISQVIFIFAWEEIIMVILGSAVTNLRRFPHGPLCGEVELIYTIYQSIFLLIHL